MQSFLSKSLFSKILAVENINLVISKEASTASFTYDTRTLTLPDWKVSKSVERLLISHEVAHALYTDSQKRTVFLNTYPEDFIRYAARALNIVEDARIEKLIQRKYIGLRKDYVIGYHELINDIGFFSQGSYDNIFDKLNHHFKAVVSGQQADIYNFDPVEQGYVDRMLKLETYDDTLELTKELIEKFGDQIQVAETSSVFTADLDSDVEVDAEIPLDMEPGCAPCSGQQTITKDISRISNYTVKAVNEARYIKKHERKGSEPEEKSKVVQYMYSVFKKKMNAQNYANQRRFKTGEIDPTVLYRYKYDEKIFETRTLKTKQKNHCVIVLIDGSSSMKEIMRAVSIQAYNIAEFCRVAKIPLRCFVFQDFEGSIIDGFGKESRVKLSEFFSKGTNFATEKKYLASMAKGGTPLSEALVALISLVEQMKQKYDVVNLMVLTDGACQNAHRVIENLRFRNTYISSQDEGNIPESVLKIFRDYFEVNVISFDLGKHPCYNSYRNKFGADIHFEVPLSYILEDINSKQFLNELVEIISK